MIHGMTTSASPGSTFPLSGPRQPTSARDLGKLFDKLPPHAIEAECALIGAMILDGQVIGEVVQIIRGQQDFYKTQHAAIYQVLVELYDHNQAIDMVHLNQRLRDLDLLRADGHRPAAAAHRLAGVGEQVGGEK